MTIDLPDIGFMPVSGWPAMTFLHLRAAFFGSDGFVGR